MRKQKITKATLSSDIIKMSNLADKGLTEVYEIMVGCRNLTTEYYETSTSLIFSYEKTYQKIKSQNYAAFAAKSFSYYLTYNKPWLQDRVNRLTRDIEIIANMRNTLLELIDDACKKGKFLREETKIKEYRYTYKFRGCSPGCQPSKGLQRIETNIPGLTKFETIIYNRKLLQKEISDYELEDLN